MAFWVYCILTGLDMITMASDNPELDFYIEKELQILLPSLGEGARGSTSWLVTAIRMLTYYYRAH